VKPPMTHAQATVARADAHRNVALDHRTPASTIRGISCILTDDLVRLYGLNKDGNTVGDYYMGFHVADLPAVIEVLRWLGAGELGRMAIDAEANTRVVKKDADE
jgi:hypothetical protein